VRLLTSVVSLTFAPGSMLGVVMGYLGEERRTWVDPLVGWFFERVTAPEGLEEVEMGVCAGSEEADGEESG